MEDQAHNICKSFALYHNKIAISFEPWDLYRTWQNQMDVKVPWAMDISNSILPVLLLHCMVPEYM